jgi:hypothetical protein
MATGIVNPHSVAVAGGAFNPETDITWHTLFWAEGTKYKATNTVNAAPIVTVPDEYGAVADYAVSSLAAGSPNFTHQTGTAGVLNGQPHWKTTSANHGTMSTGIWSKAFPSGPTTSLIIICEPDAVRVMGMLIDGPMNGGYGFVQDQVQGSYGLRLYGPDATGLTNFYSGQQLAGGSVSAIRISKSTIASAAYLHLNGLAPILFGSATGGWSGYGYPTHQGVHLNSYSSGTPGSYPFNGAMPFVGIYDGQISSHAKWNDLKAWALSHYGATLT